MPLAYVTGECEQLVGTDLLKMAMVVLEYRAYQSTVLRAFPTRIRRALALCPASAPG